MIVGVFLLQLLPAGSAQAAVLPPKGLTAASTSSSAVSLRWDAVKSAPKYRVQYSTSSKLSKAKYIRVVDNALDVGKLKPSTRYYFRVRVITTSGGSLSGYSSTFSVKTASKSGYSYLSPVMLSAKAASSSAVSLSWASRGSGIRYRVQYSSSPKMSGAKYLRFTPTKATISRLKAGTKYYFRVRVITNGGGNLSSYSDPVQGKTRAATRPVPADTKTPSSKPLRVVSYNVQCANCFSGLPDELPWSARRSAVVATLVKQDPDVMGLQEASQGWLRDSSGQLTDKSQFEDVQQRLGSKYRLVNDKRNNCVKSTTPTRCVYADQGASKGTKIIYNSQRLKLISQGSRRLSAMDKNHDERYVAWAILQQKSTGKKFLFTDTHLENKKDSSGSSAYHELLRTQTREIVQEIAKRNSQKLPVISVGDYNSSRFASPSNAPYDVTIAAGFVDPLGNSYRSTRTAPGATVEKRINTHYYGYNGYQRAATLREGWINGSYIDYIFTTPMRVSECENAAEVDAAGNYIGIIPSDHNLLRATVHLP